MPNYKKPDLFRSMKQEWLMGARATAHQLLKHREYITAEDVTVLCPLPKYLHVNLIGRLFQDEAFQVVGVTTARLPKARGHLLRKWALKTPHLEKWTSKVEADDGR